MEAAFVIFPFVALALNALLALRLFVEHMGDPRAYMLALLPTVAFLWMIYGPRLLVDHPLNGLLYSMGFAFTYVTVLGTILHVLVRTPFWRHGLLCLVLSALSIIPVTVFGKFIYAGLCSLSSVTTGR